MSFVPLLPPELYDHIFDYLDKPTLRQCALTTRNWLPRVQNHLFRSIYIYWSNCSAFTRLVDANPTLATHIATLEIEGAFGIFSMDRLHALTLDNWLRAIPDPFSRRLTNLTKLELALITIDADLVRRVFSRFPGITHLTLWSCALTSFDVFIDLFFSYQHLIRLNIAFTQDWETGPRPVVPVSESVVLPRLEVLELTSSCDNFKVLEWIVAQDLHHSIHTLLCSRMSWSSLAAFAHVLDALSPNLQSLAVDFNDQPGASDDFPHTQGTRPAFPTLPALTSLTLDVNASRLIAVPYTLFHFAHLRAPALRRLTFAVQYLEYETALLLPWARIADATACVTRTAPLERVTIDAKEKGESLDGMPLSFVNRGLSLADFEEMERAVKSAFAAQGIEKLLSFVRERVSC